MWGFNLDIIYILLNFLLLYVFYQSGVAVSQGKNYWLNAKKCIIAFTFVLGARYMRGNDYEHYLDVYKYDLEPSQRFYTFICDVMKAMGISEYGSFFVYALIFSVCLFVFLKRYRQYSMWMFPMALIFLLYFHEFMIRQALSYSFVFLYLNKLFDFKFDRMKVKELFSRKNLKSLFWCILYLTLAVSTHSANIFVLIIATVAYFFLHRPIPLFLSLPALVFTTYFFSSMFDFNVLTSYLEFIGDSDDKFTNYVNHSHKWFSDEGMSELYTRNRIFEFAELLGNIALFVLALKIIKKCENNIQAYTIYNCFIFGTLFQLAFLNLEVMNRMGYVFRILMFFPMALVLFYRKDLQSKSWTSVLFLFLLFLFYDYLKNLVYRAEMTKFLWDM